MKNIIRFLYIAVFIFVGIFVFTHPVKTETNILNAVLSSSESTLVKLSEKYSSQINVIFENADDETINNFTNSIDSTNISVKTHDTHSFLQNSMKYHKNLLSTKTAQKIQNKRYDEVTAEAMERIFDPLNIMLVPLNEDPFMLYMDYIKSLGTDELISDNYKIITLKVSSEISDKEIKKLITLQENLSKDGTKIYLTGSPIHSYYASSKSMLEINIICALSMLFVMGLCLYYFKNLKILIPIGISLGIGILSGYFAVSLIFPTIHVLTFVFSTTLIGICIDYSLHYFIEKERASDQYLKSLTNVGAEGEKILKSLTVCMLSTVCAFAVLLFSGVELLKQISVFTMTGLFSVYLTVILFYPLINFDCNVRKIELKLPNKKIFAVIFAVISFASIFMLNFDDDIRNMYVPSKKLAHAEKLLNEITGNNKKTFVIINDENIEKMLRKEEWIAKNFEGTEFHAISKFIPSEKQQRENFELRKKLYQNSLENFNGILAKQDVQKLLNEKSPQEFLKVNEDLKDFLIDENTSVMILYDFNRPEIIEQNGGKYIDIPNDVSKKIRECREACIRMLLPMFGVLVLLLSVIYDFKRAVKIVTPSVVAAMFSIALLSVTGQAINLFHILAIYLIIGFGLDYSVFKAGNHSKEAVLLSCATSVFSFALLAFTSFKLISSLGFILAVGLSVSYFMSTIESPLREGACKASEGKRASDQYQKSSTNIGTEGKKWYQVKEQSAGEKRLLLTWKIYKIFGKKAVQILAFFITFFAFLNAKETRRCSKKYLNIIGIKPTLTNQFRHFLEYSWSLVDRMEVFSGNFDYNKIIFDNKDDEKIFENGVFVICSHLGNIDIMRAFLDKYPEKRVNAFLAKEQCKIFNSFIKQIAVEKPVTTYAVEDIGIETAIEIKDKLSAGEIVFMAGDRTSKNSTNSDVQFLGHKVQFPTGTFKFAEIMDCPIVFACALRENDKYRVYVKKFIPETKKCYEQLRVEFVKFLEKHIPLAPFQFFHFYDLFED